jgi:hypothetical protein
MPSISEGSGVRAPALYKAGVRRARHAPNRSRQSTGRASAEASQHVSCDKTGTARRSTWWSGYTPAEVMIKLYLLGFSIFYTGKNTYLAKRRIKWSSISSVMRNGVAGDASGIRGRSQRWDELGTRIRAPPLADLRAASGSSRNWLRSCSLRRRSNHHREGARRFSRRDRRARSWRRR